VAERGKRKSSLGINKGEAKVKWEKGGSVNFTLKPSA